MRSRKQTLSIVQKQNQNKRMSAFLNFMRHISSAFGAEISQPLGLKTTLQSWISLPLQSFSSPQRYGCTSRSINNNERSYTFQLDTDDGGHYLLQAMTKREMNKWLETISCVTSTAAYLGHSPKPQISDHIHTLLQLWHLWIHKQVFFLSF